MPRPKRRRAATPPLGEVFSDLFGKDEKVIGTLTTQGIRWSGTRNDVAEFYEAQRHEQDRLVRKRAAAGGKKRGEQQRAKWPELREKILTLKREHPDWSEEDIAEGLSMPGKEVSRKTVRKALDKST